MSDNKNGLDLASGMVDSFRERCASDSTDNSDSFDSLLMANPGMHGDDANALSRCGDNADSVIIGIHNNASAEDSCQRTFSRNREVGEVCCNPFAACQNPKHTSPASTFPQKMPFEWLSASYVIEFSTLQIEKRIGCGGGGQVYQGWHCESEVAVKLLNSSYEDFGWYKEAERELRFLCTLHCPQIVQFIGVCINIGDIYFVTELCEKGSMQSYIRNANTAIPPKVCLQLLFDISKGMAYLHNQSPAVIHRDLKPGNVLLDGSFRAKICDFGLTRMRDSKRHMTSRVGTGYYCAPEVFMGGDDDSPYTEKMDVYSFAMVMYTLFEREEPFYNTQAKNGGILGTYQKICDGVRPTRPKDCPAIFGEIMERCWHKNPKDRPSFPQVLEMLRAVRL
jgi:serine/threonine protein kinase